MRELNKLFRNPPKGGNERGVPVTNPMAPMPRPTGEMGFRGGGIPLCEKRDMAEMAKMTPEERMQHMQDKYMLEVNRPDTGPAAQTTLLESFEAGENLSRNNKRQSGQAAQKDLRNYDRGRVETQTVYDPSGVQAYDYEAAHSDPHASATAQTQPAPYPIGRVTPVLNPDTAMTYRTDGKPNITMSGQNAPSTKPTVDGDNDEDDKGVTFAQYTGRRH